jgi:hypothetical protein
LAGCGQGEDAAQLDDNERTRLRQQALTWLTADLTAWSRLLEKQGDKVRSTALRTVQHWQQDSDLTNVRGDALAKLPDTERERWRSFWAEVEALRKQVAMEP